MIYALNRIQKIFCADTMTGFQILNCHQMMIPSKYHVEVAAYNKLPKFISKPATLGVNEDLDCTPRGHWVAVFTDDCG